MSSVNAVSSSSSNAAAAYQDQLARQLAAKQTDKAHQAKAPSQPAPPPAGDVDHDGDSH